MVLSHRGLSPVRPCLKAKVTDLNMQWPIFTVSILLEEWIVVSLSVCWSIYQKYIYLTFPITFVSGGQDSFMSYSRHTHTYRIVSTVHLNDILGLTISNFLEQDTPLTEFTKPPNITCICSRYVQTLIGCNNFRSYQY